MIIVIKYKNSRTKKIVTEVFSNVNHIVVDDDYFILYFSDNRDKKYFPNDDTTKLEIL